MSHIQKELNHLRDSILFKEPSFRNGTKSISWGFSSDTTKYWPHNLETLVQEGRTDLLHGLDGPVSPHVMLPKMSVCSLM